MNSTKKILLFCIGGALYSLVEIIWNRHTHWTMFFVGGICFRIINKIRYGFSGLKILHQSVLCSVCITVIEFISGIIINRILKLKVWDYSGMRFNIKGQICVLYSFLWVILSVIALKTDTVICNRLKRQKAQKFKCVS